MNKIIILFIILCHMTMAKAEKPANMPNDVFEAIVAQVIEQVGYFDSVAVEQAIGLWQLEQPIPNSDGELLSNISCSPCSVDEGDVESRFNSPRNVKVKTKIRPNGTYPTVLKIRWKKPKKLAADLIDLYQVSHYLVHIIKDGQSYEVFKKKAKYRSNGKLKKKQGIKFRDRETGDYTVQVQAVYEEISVQNNKTTSSIKAVASTKGALSGSIGVGTESKQTTLADITGALKTCLIANGFDTTTVVQKTFKTVQCSGKGLQNSDVVQLELFTGVLLIDISNNPAINNISGLSNLAYLQHLNISNNSNINIPSFADFSSLQNLYLANLGLTQLPDIGTNSSLNFLDLSNNQIANGFVKLPDNLAVLKLNNNPVVNCDGLQGIQIETLELTNQIVDVSSCSSIVGLKYLTIKDAQLLPGVLNVQGFSGFCGLTLNNTSVTKLKAKRPIQTVNLINNAQLINQNTIVDAKNTSTNVYPALNPPYVNLAGSNNMNCQNVYNKETKWKSNTKNNMSVPIYTKVGNIEKTSEICPTYNIAPYYTKPKTCKPNSITGFAVVRQTKSNEYSLSWDTTNHDIWKVSSYDILLNEEKISSIPSGFKFPLVIENTKQAATFKVRACVSDFTDTNNPITSCSDWVAPVSETAALAKVENLNFTWANQSTQLFNLEFTYPNNLVNNPSSTPDYFKVTPGMQAASIDPNNPNLQQINTIPFVSNTIFYSESLLRDDFIDPTFRVQACKMIAQEEICGPGVSIIIPDPIIAISASLQKPTTTSALTATTTNGDINFTLTKDNNNSQVDYFKVTESQPTPVIDDVPISFADLANDKEYEIQAIDGAATLTLKRMVNGLHHFSIASCLYSSATNPETCSQDKLELDRTVARTVNNENLAKNSADNFFKNLRWREKYCSDYDENQFNPSTNTGYGCISPGSAFVAGSNANKYEKRVIYWEYGNLLNNNTQPDYYHISKVNISGDGSNIEAIDNTATNANTTIFRQINNRCINKQQATYDVNNSSSLAIKYAKQQFVHNAIAGSNSTNKDCRGGIRASADGLWRIKACYSGIGCTSGQEINLFEQSQYNATEPPVDEERAAITADNLQSGLWWNPHQASTGWYFNWKNNSENPNRQLSDSYNLLAYWVSYRYINDVWSPIWMHADLSLQQADESGNQFYSGQLLYSQIVGDSTKQTGIGTIKILLNENQNNRAKIELNVDYAYGMLTQADIDPDFALTDDYFRIERSQGQDQRDTITIPLEIASILLVGDDGTSTGGTTNSRFGASNDSDHYSGIWQYQDGKPENNTIFAVWKKRNLETVNVFMYDTAGEPFWLFSQSCGATCSPDLTDSYFDAYINTASGDNSFGFTGGAAYNFFSKTTGFNPLAYRPVRDWIEVEFLAKAGRSFDNAGSVQAFKQAKFWLNAAITTAVGSRNLNINLGNSSNLITVNKIANINHIGFNIQNYFDQIQYENQETGQVSTTCDPNTIGPCKLSLNWYVGDHTGQNTTLKPYYRYSATDINSANFTPLNAQSTDLSCMALPVNKLTVPVYECQNLKAGTYEFQLRRDSYSSNVADVAIAQSSLLTVLPCTIANDPTCSTVLDGGGTSPPNAPDANVNTINSTINHAPGDGPIPGTGGVSGGSATYTLPLTIPPGRNGMTPSLSVNYSSKGGNGILGVGWSLSIGSSIYRCPQTIAQDGYSIPVRLDDNTDRLCLDGQRLMLVSGTGYFVNGAEYRTEQDSFAKIVRLYVKYSG